jgi:hypothetical protein
MCEPTCSFPDWIWLEVIGDDGLPLRNIYEHGWRSGTERVHVRLVFTVEAFEPGASLEITDVVVRWSWVGLPSARGFDSDGRDLNDRGRSALTESDRPPLTGPLNDNVSEVAASQGSALRMPEVSDADRLYLQRVARDCEQLLGPEIELGGLEVDAAADVVLRLRYRLGRAEWTSEGHGETVIAAHAALRDQLVLDRIRLGVRALVRQGR